MKKLLSCVLVVFILLINVIPSYAANSTLSIGVDDLYVDKNETFNVSIRISADSGISSLSFTVSYNPDEFEYIPQSGTVGGLFDGEETFVPSNTGKLVFSGLSTEGISAGGTVLSFKLKSKLHGGAISIGDYKASDIDGNKVSLTRSSVKLNCGHGHAKWVVTQEATCMIYGREELNCSCGYKATREIQPNDNHTFTESKVIQEPTCTKTGIEVGTCTACGLEGARSVIPALGHKYSDWKVTKEPTADSMGIRERVCKTCNDKEAQMIAPTGEPVEDATNDESTEPSTELMTDPTTEPSTDGYFEIETEPSTEKKDALGGITIGSDIAFIAVVALAVLMLGVIIAYLVLLRKKK